jgi:cyclohexanecarboxylate-CoA ligase
LGAKKAIELIRRKVHFTMASTPFLTDLPKVSVKAVWGSDLRTFLCAERRFGPLVEHARKTLGAKSYRRGDDRNGAVTLIKIDDDDERASTLGLPLPGADSRRRCRRNRYLHTEGRLFVRSCSNFGGYLNRPI